MEQLGNRVRQITAELRDYLETRFDLVVLNVSEKITLWIGEAVQQVIGFVILAIGLLFGLVALGFYLGSLLDSPALGFACVGGPVFLIGLIILLLKPKGIARKVQNQFMNDILEALEDKPREDPVLLNEGSEKIEEQINE